MGRRDAGTSTARATGPRGPVPLALGLLALAGLLGLSGVADAGRRGLRPRPATGPRAPGRLLQNDACIQCHAEVAAEWRGSLHQRAWEDPMFQQAFAIEPMPFCQGCHAPEADPRAEVPARAAHVGVTCVSCHVVEGEVLAAPGPREDLAPHAIRREAGFDGDAACAACHDFDFPSVPGQPMQATVAEHRRSPERERSCADCHMPLVGEGPTRHRAHRFAVISDPALLRSAASIQASRPGPEQIEVTLVPTGVGHAFPTGDLFRRLVVRARVEGDARWQERFLARHFRPISRDGHVVRVQIADDRVGPDAAPSRVQLGLPGAAGKAVEWEVVYQRVLHVPRGLESEATVVDETRLAGARLPAEE